MSINGDAKHSSCERSSKLLESFEIDAAVKPEKEICSSGVGHISADSKVVQTNHDSNQNYILGAVMMIFNVLSFTAAHVCIKYLMVRTPSMTPFDCTLGL